MKNILITVLIIGLVMCVAGGLMYHFGDTPKPEPAEPAAETQEPMPTIKLPEEDVIVEEEPEPTPSADRTIQPGDQTIQTTQTGDQTTQTTTQTPDTSGEYRGWPAIPADQLPQPDQPSGGTQIVIPSNPQIGTYNGNSVIIVPNSHSVTDRSSLDYLAEEIFLLTNQERVAHGLKELAYAYDLQDAADTRAQEASVLFSHTRPNGQSCHDIVTKNYNITGENLIQADRPVATPANLVAEWMSSSGHRANILLKDYTKLAVGVYEKNGVVYACQIFVG
jgi:uncharacterized protein YkwD